MANLAFINGSPRSKDSLSTFMIDYFIAALNSQDASHFSTYKMHTLPDLSTHFNQLLRCDVIVIVSPLYVDALPSQLIDFLQKLECYQSSHPIQHHPILYGFINCGFIEGHQNHIALSILENYALRMGWQFGGGIGLGGGEMFKGTKDSIPKEAKILRPIYTALDTFLLCLSSASPLPQKQILVEPHFPKSAFMFMGGLGWISSARNYGVSLSQLFHKPHHTKSSKP